LAQQGKTKQSQPTANGNDDENKSILIDVSAELLQKMILRIFMNTCSLCWSRLTLCWLCWLAGCTEAKSIELQIRLRLIRHFLIAQHNWRRGLLAMIFALFKDA